MVRANIGETSIGHSSPMEQHMEADKDAVAFLKRYRRAIYFGFHLQRVPPHHRDDLFQELSVRIVERFRSGNYPEQHAVSFAVTIARHAAISNYRRKGLAMATDADPDHQVATEPNAAEQLIQLEGHERLHACIELLSPMRRAVIKARLRGMMHQDIAAEFGITEQAAKLLYLRGRESLRKLLLTA